MKQNILVLPNGHGKLKYIYSLQKELSDIGHNVSIPIVHSDGVLSVKSMKEGIIEKVSSISKDGKLIIIAHCSSVIALTEIKDPLFWSNVKKVIIYNYLATPKIHLERFLKQAEIYGTNLDIKGDMDAINDFSYISLRSIKTSVIIIHPKTVTNNLRANSIDLENINSNISNIKIIKPEDGYEINDNYQIDQVKKTVLRDFKELLNP